MPTYDKTAARQELTDSIASCIHGNGEFSDLRVVCGGDEYFCHKIIICKQSDWFLSACTGGFKEAGSAIIELHEEDPSLVAALIGFFCQHDYLTPTAENFPPLSFHVLVFTLAEKYLIPRLQELAKDKFVHTLESQSNEPAEVAHAVGQAYGSTLDPQRLLKNAIVSYMLKNGKALLGSDLDRFDSVMLEHPEFGADMTKAFAKTWVMPGKRSIFRTP